VSFTKGLATKVSIIDALTAGDGESTNVDVVEVGTTLVVDDEEDATTDVDVDDDVEDDVDEDEDVDADTGVDDDVSGVAATVVDVVDVDVLVVVLVVVVVVVDVAKRARPFSETAIMRSPDSLNPIPTHVLFAGSSASHVAPRSRETKSLPP
jgi:hypothetical protein